MLNNDALSARWFPFISASAVFLVSTVMVMLGPILLPLAADLHTSVALTAQLAAVTSLVWGLSAITVGPVSDTYGRRRVLLSGMLLMSLFLGCSTLATSYGQMFFARILTGFAAAMIPPTCYAACADQLSPGQSSRAMSWSMAAGVLGGALGQPAIAWLADLGSWHTPFLALSAALALLSAGVWAVFPHRALASHESKSFFAHFREVSASGVPFWLLLSVNFLLQSASWGTMSFLPAYLMQTYHLPLGAITLPLLLNGLGIMAGAIAGGPLATHPRRTAVIVSTLPLGGLLIAIAYVMPLSIWATVSLTAAAGGMLIVSQPMVMTMLLSLAGEARGTATGIYSLSTQFGAMSGTALAGVLLAFGGFSYIGISCLAIGIIASAVMTCAIKALPRRV